MPSIFVGLRLSATTALLLLIASEMIGANKGVGFQVMNAQYNFQIPLMFAAIVLLAGARPGLQLRAGAPAAAALPLERRQPSDRIMRQNKSLERATERIGTV